MESTYNWYWLVDGLEDRGYDVKLANTNAIQQYDGIKHTNDYTDVRYLAHLLRLGILPEGYIYPSANRGIRDALRRRQLMVQQRTVLHLILQSHVARLTGIRLSASQIRALDKEKLAGFLKQTQDQQTPQILLALYQDYSQAIEKLERQVLQQVKDLPGYRPLTSVPGIGKILALIILLETGDINRFPKVGNYASYARCVSSQRISNSKSKGQNNRKNGNRYLAWAFMEAAHFAAIWSEPIKRYYQSKKDKKHVMVAKKAVANKLARACYHMLKQQTPFDISKAFG